MKKILLIFVTMLLFAMPTYAVFEITQQELDICKMNGIDENDLNGFIADRQGWGLSDEEINARLRVLIDECKQNISQSENDKKVIEQKIDLSKKEKVKLSVRKFFNYFYTGIKNNIDYIIVFVISILFVSAYLLYVKKKLKNIPINNYSILGVVSLGFLSFIIISQPLEYGFYQVLRWLVCSFSAWTSVKIYQKSSKSFWLMTFIALAIIFNPVLPLKFDEDIWIPIDIVTALIFIAYSIKSIQKKVD